MWTPVVRTQTEALLKLYLVLIGSSGHQWMPLLTRGLLFTKDGLKNS
jgi:hypothetical protein